MTKKEEQIQVLSKLLLKLLEEEESQVNQPETTESKIVSDNHLKTINETLNDFKTLGVEIDVVRKIMKRVDEVYGSRRTGDYEKLYGNLDDRNKTNGLSDKLYNKFDL